MKKRVLLGFVLFIITSHAMAQEREIYREDRDNVPYYFGLSLGYNNSYLHPEKDPVFLQNDSVLSVEPGSSGGLRPGTVGDGSPQQTF